MIARHQKFGVTRISIFLIGLFLGAIFLAPGSASALTGLKIIDPVHGNAKIRGEDVGYYHFGAKIVTEAESALIFKQGKCSIADKKGKKYSRCWIHIAGASAGLSFTQKAPITVKTLGVELEGGKSSDAEQWNASMITGSDGSLEFKIPKAGYVVLDFLWEVPNGFSPSRVKIGDLTEVSLNM